MIGVWLHTSQFWIPAMIIAAVAYLLGCFNGAVIISKYILRDDVRNHGSGNAGLTNFHRTFGGPLTALVVLCDVFKAVLAILFAVWLSGHMLPFEEVALLFGVSDSAAGIAPWRMVHTVELMKYWAALFCLLGHMFPAIFGFRGGKGILSGGTIAIMLDWRVALVVWGGFFVLVLLTRYVSLGSVYAGASFPVATWAVFGQPVLVGFACLLGGLVIFMHRANIRRLLQGNESKFSFHKKK